MNWERFKKLLWWEQLHRIHRSIVGLRAELCRLITMQERMEKRIMATVQEVADALAAQNQAILEEVNEINAAMDALKVDPQKLDEIVAGIKANTAEVTNIIRTPLPDPDSVPVP